MRGANEVDQDVSQFDAPDLSAVEHTEHIAQRVAAALEGTGLVGIVEVKANEVGQFQIMGRVKAEEERDVAHGVVKAILKRTQKKYNTHICKQFFLVEKKGAEVLVYAWDFAFGCKRLDQILPMAHAIVAGIEDAVPPREVVASPLMGPSTPAGSVGAGGKKGASPIRAGK